MELHELFVMMTGYKPQPHYTPASALLHHPELYSRTPKLPTIKSSNSSEISGHLDTASTLTPIYSE